MKKIIITFIHVYQKFFSPDHSVWAKLVFPNGYCKYHPTCSAYIKEAFQKEKLFIAAKKSMKRFTRCNPFTKGGFDYIETK